MRVFVTGASGYIGNRVAACFSRAGHHVVGLVRSEESAHLLRRQEIVPLIGSMENPESYLMHVEKAEVLIHAASDTSPKRIENDRKTLEHLIRAATSAPLPRTLIYTSGCWIYGNTGDELVDEASPVNPLELVKWRPQHEEIVLKAESRHLRTLVFRPGAVYGGHGHLTSHWFSSAKEGKVILVDSGKNVWSMVHVEDLARAFVLAAEKELSGLVFNINDGSALTTGEMAHKIAAFSGSKVESISYESALKLYGAVTQGLTVHQRISNERARRLLGWTPAHTNFLSSLPLHFASWEAHT